MRPTSLLLLAQGFGAVPQELLPTFEAQLSEREEPLPVIKPHEANSVVRLVQELQAHGARTPHHFEGFVFSFSIPQISSEFDLLKITGNAVINIELKSENVGTQRMAEQLARTRHYLGPLGRAIYTFTFVSDSATLYERTSSGTMQKVGINRLVQALESAGDAYDGRLEDLFRVSNYLVSPLNDTSKFLGGQYFLTNHQMQIKASFLKACTSPAAPPVFLVYGSAGTGKSLLLYDLARTLNTARRVCVIHCGILCSGHEQLNQRQSAFHVISAKKSEHIALASYGALLVDEAQRMWPSQLKRVMSIAVDSHIPLYLSMDRQQVLSQREENYDLEKIVREACPSVSVWELSRKIRTNRELTAFIRALFGLSSGKRFRHTNRVKVGIAQDARGAQELVEAFRHEGYQYITLAHTSHADRELDELDALDGLDACERKPREYPNPHMVIGQEFDKVVMAVGPHFLLENTLHRQLLYQGLTRARSDLALVVYDNSELAEHLLTLGKDTRS